MSKIADDIAAKNRLDRKTEIIMVIFDYTRRSSKAPPEKACEAMAEEILALSERFNHTPEGKENQMKFKFNEAQQKERAAHGIGSIAFALVLIVLIALAKLAGPVLAILWAVVSVIGGVAHYKQVMSLATKPQKAENA